MNNNMQQYVSGLFDFTERVIDQTQAFTGREWVFNAINQWLADPDGTRVFFLSGGPGMGKSAISARLVQMMNEDVDGSLYPTLAQFTKIHYHFCVAQNDPWLEPLDFVRSLSLALAGHSPAFAQALTQIGNSEQEIHVVQDIHTVAAGGNVAGVVIQELNISNLNARSAFSHIVRKPLEDAAIDEPILIIVDSLDEALTFNEDENIATLLSDVTDGPRDLPANVRILVTGRNDQRLADLFEDHAYYFDLINNVPHHVDDIELYTRSRLDVENHDSRAVLAQQITTASKANFLYAYYIIEDVLQRSPLPEFLEADALPDDLNGIYRSYLKRELARKKREWKQSFRPLLSLLAVARSPGLTRTQLATASGLDNAVVDDALEVSGQYLSMDDEDGPMMIYHQSFRDFLLTDSRYRIYPHDAHKQLAQAILQRFTGKWHTCKDSYALRHTTYHLASVATNSPQPERHELTQELVSLVLDEAFQQAHIDVLNNLKALQHDLDLALQTAASNQTDTLAEALLPLIRISQYTVDFTDTRVRSDPLFDLASSGKLETAKQHLDLFPTEQKWQQVAALALAWAAADNQPDEARILVEQMLPSIQEALLHRFARRVLATLNQQPFDELDGSLPAPPDLEIVQRILSRLGGESFGGGLEMMPIHLENELQHWQPVGNIVTGPIEEYLASEAIMPGNSDMGPMSVAGIDGLHLTAFAVDEPEQGQFYFEQYIDLHASNSYVYYRNVALWFLLDAALRHPETRWAQLLTQQIVMAVLVGKEITFREALPLAVMALRENTTDGAAAKWLMKRTERAFAEVNALGYDRGQSDSWGKHKRTLAALAEAYSVLGLSTIAHDLLDRAFHMPQGYAGYQTAASLALAESVHVVQPNDITRIDKAVENALIAHNITEAVFCIRSTARVNAMREYWYNTNRPFDVARMVVKLSADPNHPDFATCHIIGEQYEMRDSFAEDYVALPGEYYTANTLAQLVEVYKRPLSEFEHLNSAAGWATDEMLLDGTLVNVPDPEFAPHLATRFAAEILVEKTLSTTERVRLIQRLVPIAARNPTALDTILARLLLAAQPDDPELLNSLMALADSQIFE